MEKMPIQKRKRMGETAKKESAVVASVTNKVAKVHS